MSLGMQYLGINNHHEKKVASECNLGGGAIDNHSSKSDVRKR
jgi:hypothetical protein